MPVIRRELLFLKNCAITENHLYSKVYAKGKKHATRTVVLYVLRDLHANRLMKQHPMKVKINRVGITVSKKIGAKTLFATHFHELTELEEKYDGVVNYNIAARKKGDDIMFLRKIVRGAADDSYGIEVAKLSGIPNAVIERAKEVLRMTENEGLVTYKTINESDMQMSFEMQSAQEILKDLKAIDVNTLTPIESMQILFDICKKAKEL